MTKSKQQYKATPEDWAHVEAMSGVEVCSYSRCLLEIRDTLTTLSTQTETPTADASGWQPQAQTEEQVAEGLRQAFRQAIEEGVIAPPYHQALQRIADAQTKARLAAEDESVRQRLIEMGWTPPAEYNSAQPAQDEQGQEVKAKALWKQMDRAYEFMPLGTEWPAVMDAVADWLHTTHPAHAPAANTLRAEAQATREGCREA